MGETAALIATLSQAAEAGDAATFGRVARSLALTASSVGATALAEGARLGVACATRRPGRIGDVILRIEALCAAARLHAAELLARPR